MNPDKGFDRFGTGALNRLTWAYGSDRGKIRPLNEDNLLAMPIANGEMLLAVVADGLGGHGGGDIASRILVETFESLAAKPLPTERRDCYDWLRELVYQADIEIRNKAASSIRLTQMGSTMVGALIGDHEILHVYAGDCRLYHFSPSGEIDYRTADHSIVQVLVDQGEITPEEMKDHPMRSVVTSCLGGGNSSLTIGPSWKPDVDGVDQAAFRPLGNDEFLLLCSDGLCGFVDDNQLIEILRDHHHDPEATVAGWIQAALDAGGEDNITVIGIRVNPS